MQRQFRTVQTQLRLVAQCAFLNQALFKTRNNFGVHAAMVVLGDFRNALAHAFWKTDNELVSCATGIIGLFHRAHIFNRFSSKGEAVLALGREMSSSDCLFAEMFNQPT